MVRGEADSTRSVARQGSSSVFQITCHKNLNGFHRVSPAMLLQINEILTSSDPRSTFAPGHSRTHLEEDRVSS